MNIKIISIPESNNNFMKDDVTENSTKSLKAIERSSANVEAEKGEVVISPNLDYIYSILGKKHSKGGTPLGLDINSFIYSNDKSLNITKDEKKAFMFKNINTESTPADVIKKEIDIEKHNIFSQDLKNEKIRDIAYKNTAKIMIAKNMEKMGQIAYLQESKKNFKQGIPTFANGTAPIFKEHVANAISRRKQYMKYGGQMLKKYVDGGDFFDSVDPVRPKFVIPKDVISTEKRIPSMSGDPVDPSLYTQYRGFINKDIFERPEFKRENLYIPLDPSLYTKGRNVGLQHKNKTGTYGSMESVLKYQSDWLKMQKQIGNVAQNMTEQEAYDKYHSELYGSSFDNTDGVNNSPIDNKYGLRNASHYYPKQDMVSLKTGEVDLVTWNYLPDKEKEKIAEEYGYTKEEFDKFKKEAGIKTVIRFSPGLPPLSKDPIETINIPTKIEKIPGVITPAPPLKPGEAPNKYVSEESEIPLSLRERSAMLSADLKALSVKRYMPMKQQYNPILNEATLLNKQSNINQVNGNYNATLQASRQISNPAMRAALTGNALSKTNDNLLQVNSQYDNQNVQIENNQNTSNVNLLNEARLKNISFASNYYDSTIKAYDNYDAEKEFKQGMATKLRDETIDKNEMANNIIQQMLQYPLLNPDGTPRKDKYNRILTGTSFRFDPISGRVVYNRPNGFNTIPGQQENNPNNYKTFYKNIKEISPNATDGAILAAYYKQTKKQ